MAEKVREFLKFNDEPINNICDLLEANGIKIFLIDSDLKNFFGFCLSTEDDGPAIGVNKSEKISVERKIFTVAHELGHILLHPASFNSAKAKESNDAEKEANIFASHLLMPEKGFKKEWEKNKGLHWVRLTLHVKRVFKVSYKTVLIRAIEEKLIDNIDLVWQKFAIDCKRFGFNLKNHNEPESISQEDFGPEPIALDNFDFVDGRLSFLVREAFESEKITMTKAADILGISLMEMRDLSNSWRTVA
jgi:Zn-dependent peptidase ImmA (M78 family)